jgi:hypothetical protein
MGPNVSGPETNVSSISSPSTVPVKWNAYSPARVGMNGEVRLHLHGQGLVAELDVDHDRPAQVDDRLTVVLEDQLHAVRLARVGGLGAEADDHRQVAVAARPDLVGQGR